MSVAKLSGSSKIHSMPAFRLALLHPRFWFTWLGLILFFFFSLLPFSITKRVGFKLGELAAKKNKKRFNIAKTNLSQCFPEKTQAEINAMVVEHFRFQMCGLVHYGLIWWAPLSRLRKCIEVEGFDQVDRFRQQGKNIIILTCHTAGLEFLGIALSMQFACAGPYKPMRNEVINWLVARGRARLGTLVYTRDDGFRPLIRAARNGHMLIYLGDEDLGVDVSVFAPFFGVQKATVSVLGRLAKSCNAVVVPCVGFYNPEGAGYIVKMLPAINDFPSGQDTNDAVLVNIALEKIIRECLLQYFWTLRIFQTRPSGEAALYQ
jgi:lauroyl-KDO2-lipid IV(A) myristoyltransferase